MVGEPHKADETEETRALPPVTQPASVRRVARDGTALDRIDVLAEETPVALVYNGVSHAVMMASPADLEDFALGFSVSEGIADDKTDIGEIEAVAVDQGVEVRIALSSRAFWRLKERRRTLAGRTGCGLCGVDSLEQTVRVMEPVKADLKVSLDAIHRALDNLPEAQINNRATRSMHAAAFATAQGELKLVREDVGRHNALDKLIGGMLRGGLDPTSGVCLITSRCSYEMVQKAVVAGFPILAAVSAPTLMARRLAEAHNLTLIALARHDSAVLVSHPERVYLNPDPIREGDPVTTQRLVHMANQVASFFASYPEAEAIDGTANHLKSFWDPRMRREIEAHLRDEAGAGLSHIAMEAVKRIAQKDAHSGDAGKKSA